MDAEGAEDPHSSSSDSFIDDSGDEDPSVPESDETLNLEVVKSVFSLLFYLRIDKLNRKLIKFEHEIDLCKMFQLQEPMTEEEIEELIADFLEVEGKVR